MRYLCGSVAAMLVVAACAQQEEFPGPNERPSAARVQELEARARSIARMDGCDRLDQCAAAPVGAKACGGPRTYLVYCKATTDELELSRVLEELRRVEEAYNREAEIGSDCAYVSAPALRLEGRTCGAAIP
ncbi:MAG: hypothetical protein ACT4PJ_15250 [Gemmatimonadaceae bacterium]